MNDSRTPSPSTPQGKNTAQTGAATSQTSGGNRDNAAKTAPDAKSTNAPTSDVRLSADQSKVSAIDSKR